MSSRLVNKKSLMFLNFLIFIYILITLAMVTIILAQPGKGFGLESSHSGASKTVFGSSGPRMIQRKVTAVLFSIWVLFTLLLGGIISRSRQSVLMSAIEEEERTEVLLSAAEPALDFEEVPEGPSSHPTPAPTASEAVDAEIDKPQ